ncbi:mCG144767, partial [Mus musculus]
YEQDLEPSSSLIRPQRLQKNLPTSGRLSRRDSNTSHLKLKALALKVQALDISKTTLLETFTVDFHTLGMKWKLTSLLVQ